MPAPQITPLPTPPTRSDPANFAARGDALMTALPVFVTETNALATNLTALNDAAGTAAASASTSAGTSATARDASIAAAAAAAASAVTAAAAPGAPGTSTSSVLIGVGVKTLTTQASKLLAAGQWVNVARTSDPSNTRMLGLVSSYDAATGVLNFTVAADGATGAGTFTDWTITAAGTPVSAAALAAKLDKTNGTTKGVNVTLVDLGTIAAAGTATVDFNAADVHRIQAGGNITIAASNVPGANIMAERLILAVNFGGKTTAWPAGNWPKADGSPSVSPSAAGVTFQTAGTDRILVWTEGSTGLNFKVMR
ncbi:hypothetical protein VLK31_28175 [Variovorax sp. H27-G14]|uniref:hypothetical protein n=1 Tax=Variovorax sp. H27-G14 TaxID=3111914 RepID=UPI0038FC2B27